ncbi:hypothetical protein SARC_04832 [Sphaeroforma arctica JP610]|uniref:Uncharacterized protein n=1 Tax=Sphaeroforma arctica JP610 TaxID=667725 RepID=A0A0L0G224_9EUKA|nr:hypothetical protein SARC_04832 [Sphaeroforma arctica JP610]KNC82889.1 hypothetical protein SARC_04832 [Sphaeroforma arctica JP610]|eukprot:XP_014156791.1 hypothetical protein SARC_04832 [Sphaeroforma arctica JP610]
MQTQTQTKTHPTQPETPAPTRATAGTHNPTATSSPPEHAPVQTHSIQQRRIEPAVQSAGATDETEQLHVVPRLPSQPTNVAQVGQPYKSAAAAVQSVGASDETEQLNVVPQLPSQPTNMARVAQPYKSAAAAFASLRGGNQLSDVMAAAHMREDDQNTGHIRAMGAKAGARAAVDMRRPLPIQNRTNMNSEYAKGNVVYIDTRLAPGMGGLNILRRRIAIGGKSRATPSPTPLPAFMPVDAEGTLDQRLNSYLQSIESKRVLHRGRNNGRNNAQLWDAIPVDLLRRRTAA